MGVGGPGAGAACAASLPPSGVGLASAGALHHESFWCIHHGTSDILRNSFRSGRS